MSKVLIVVPSLMLGGAEKFTTELFNEIKMDKKMVILSHNIHNVFKVFVDKNNKDIYVCKHKNPIFKYIWLNSIIKKYKPDYIQTNLHSIIYVKNSRKYKTFHTVHNIASKELPKFMRKIAKRKYKKNTYPVAISEIIKQTIIKEYNIENVHVVKNGIDTKKYLENSIIIDKRPLNLVCVARFSEQKDHQRLLRVFSEISKDFPESKLLLFGEGPLKENLIEQSNQLNLSDKIEFCGSSNQIEKELNKASLFILLSKYEGYPLSLLEAMSNGLPIIATDVGGNSEIVENQINGLISNDDYEIISFSKQVLSDKELRIKISVNNLSKSKLFDNSIMAKKYEEIFINEKN